jgi:hypothetical protein
MRTKSDGAGKSITQEKKVAKAQTSGGYRRKPGKKGKLDSDGPRATVGDGPTPRDKKDGAHRSGGYRRPPVLTANKPKKPKMGHK